MPTANLRLNIRSIGNDDGATRQLGNAARTFGNNAGRLGRLIGRSARSGSLWVKAAILFAPALFTLAKAALAGAGGLLALAAVTTAAALPWIALAITAARNADKMGGAGRRFEGAATRVGDAWMDLARRTAPLTLGPAVDVLNGMAAAIPKLEPLIRQVAPVFAQVGRDIRNWLEGPGFERFTSNLMDFGVPAFRNFVAAGRDFLATVGVGFRAFLPLAREMGDTFARGAASLRSWAAGGGFDRFLDGVRREWPTTKRSLDELGQSMGIIVGLLDDLGPSQLGALDTALGLFNRIDPDRLRDIALGLGALLVGKELFELLAALALFKSGGMEIAGGVALLAAAGSLEGAGLSLLGMAADIEALALRVATSTRVSVNSDALDRIRDIWDDIKDGGAVTLAASSINTAVVVAMGVATTAATLVLNASSPAVFSAVLDAVAFTMQCLAILLIWFMVRLNAANAIVFRATAVSIVTAVALLLMAVWAGVRILALIPVIFRATANGAAAIAGMARAVTAWRQLSSLPRSWSGTATANTGGVVSGSAATVSAWRSVLALPRAWSAVASVVVNGGFGGISGGSVTIAATPRQGGYGPLPGPVLNFLGNIPGFDDFGSSAIIDPQIIDDFIGGIGFDPGDFGDFTGATGGQISTGGFSNPSAGSPTGRREQHVHVHGDIWVRNQTELEAVLAEALAQLD